MTYRAIYNARIENHCRSSRPRSCRNGSCASNCVHYQNSAFYRHKFDEVGVHPKIFARLKTWQSSLYDKRRAA